MLLLLLSSRIVVASAMVALVLASGTVISGLGIASERIGSRRATCHSARGRRGCWCHRRGRIRCFGIAIAIAGGVVVIRGVTNVAIAVRIRGVSVAPRAHISVVLGAREFAGALRSSVRTSHHIAAAVVVVRVVVVRVAVDVAVRGAVRYILGGLTLVTRLSDGRRRRISAPISAIPIAVSVPIVPVALVAGEVRGRRGGRFERGEIAAASSAGRRRTAVVGVGVGVVGAGVGIGVGVTTAAQAIAKVGG